MSSSYRKVFLVQSTWKAIRWYNKNLATRHSSNGPRHSPPATRCPVPSYHQPTTRPQREKLCTCITLFCTFFCRFLHDCDVKMPNFALNGKRKQATTKFYFSFWTWIRSLGIQLQEDSPLFDKVSILTRNNRDKDWKNSNSLFNDFLVAAVSLDLKVSNAVSNARLDNVTRIA